MTLFDKPFELRPVVGYPTPRYPREGQLQAALAEDESKGHVFAAPMITSVVVASLSGVGCSRTPAAQSNQQSTAPVVVGSETEPNASAAKEPVVIASPEAPKVVPPPAGPANMKHSFTWEASQLPIEWHPYGTGRPSRLSEEKARAAIESVFAEAGIRIANDVNFSRSGVDVELDGYDATKRIGYEYVTWQDLEDPVGFRGKKDGEDGNDFDKMISHDEMKRIQSLEATGAEHVIIVSNQDNRFEHNSWQPDAGEPEQMELNLKAAVKEYVTWLRAQGAL